LLYVTMAGALVAIAASCNSITGLNDYEKVDSVGAGGDAGDASQSDVASPDVVPEASGDVEADAVVEADAPDGGSPDADAALEGGGPDAEAGPDVLGDVSADANDVGTVDPEHRWARWHMPHESVPEGGVDAGPYRADASAVDGGYFDNITQLRWSISPTNQMSLGEAAGVCADLLGGYRLPTRIELVTLLEPTRTPPYHSMLTGDVETGEYWTLSEVRNQSTPSRWVADFETGEVKPRDESAKAYVRCVSVQ